MAEHNTILYILHSQSCSQIVADRKEELWLHPVINNMQLVLSVGYYGQTVCFGGSEDTSFFIYGLVSNVNLNSCTLFHLYRKQAIFLERRMNLPFSCFVCLKKAQCGVRSGLHCTTWAFPCQQEEGCWTQVIHRCICLCSVFGRERTQEELQSQLKRRFVHRYSVFSYTVLTFEI